MNESKNNQEYYEDEIDLRELIMALWKRKKMILALTLIAAIIAASFSMFILSPLYETKLNIVISMPEIYHTRYGEYKLPITTNEQYIDLITSNDVLINTLKKMDYAPGEMNVSKLSKRITIAKVDTKANTVQNNFTVTVSADNPDEALKLAQNLYDSYIEFMDVMTKERVINYYLNYFNIELMTLNNNLDIEKENLAKNELLLSQTSKTIDTNSNVEIKSPLSENSDYLVPVETANPNYIKIETGIIEGKQMINTIESSLDKYGEYLEELNVEKTALDKYYETGKTEKLISSIVGIVESNIYLPSAPIAPTDKSSPKNALNIVIGAVLGAMIGVMAALFKEYWFKEK